jgi:hypothetical protein
MTQVIHLDMCLDLVYILDRFGIAILSCIVYQDMNWLWLLLCLVLSHCQVLLYRNRKVFNRSSRAHVQLQARQLGRCVLFLNRCLGRLTSEYTPTHHYNVEVWDLGHVLYRSLAGRRKMIG